MRYSKTYLEHFQAPRNIGEIDAPEGAAEAEHKGGGCFDRIRVTLRVRGGLVEEANFKARACSGTIAAASAGTEWAAGRPLEEVARVTPETLDDLLGGVPEKKRHSVELVAEALRLASADALEG